MKFVQAQFSLKYEPRWKIRRDANHIEDLLQEYYGTPQIMPLPDDIAAEAPRIVFASHGGHSQINFSQISADFTVGFDGDFVEHYEHTKSYIQKRVQLLKQVLLNIGIDEYYFFGLTYNIHLDIGRDNPLKYINKLLGDSFTDRSNLYEVMQRITSVEEDKFFINQQISTFKEFQNNGINVPTLMSFLNSKLIQEGVSVSLDVNDRYAFLNNGTNTSMSEFDCELNKIFDLIERTLQHLEA